MARKTERVSLMVTPEEKGRWAEHYPTEDDVGGPYEYEGLADLVRTSVRRELSGYHDRPAQAGETGASADLTADLTDNPGPY